MNKGIKKTGVPSSGGPEARPDRSSIGSAPFPQTPSQHDADLRRLAEDLVRKQAAQSPEDSQAQSPEETRRMLHDLRVLQIELEMQNEELRRAQEELEASRERYFDLYDMAPVGYFTLSEPGQILQANLTAATGLGVTRGGLVQQPLTRFILPEDQDIYYRHRKQLFTTRKPQVCELRMVKLDGATFWARLEATVAEDSDGAPVCRVVLSDITERKHAEHERETTLSLMRLLNSDNNTRELIGTVTDFLQEWSGFEAVGVRLKDGDDYPYYETRGFTKEFVELENYLCARDLDGQFLRDSIGNPVIECMCGNILCGRFDPKFPFFTEQGSFWTNCTTDLLASTTEAERQTRTRNRCNGEGYESVGLIPLRFAGTTYGLLQLNDRRKGQFTPKLLDLVERLADSIATALAQRQAQAALRESEARFRSIVESAPDAIFIADENGAFFEVNETACRQLGYTREQLLQRRVFDIVPDRLAGKVTHRLQTMQPSEGSYESVHKRVDGTEIPVELNVKKVTFGAKPYMMGVVRDLTERKKAEKQIQDQYSTLRGILESVNSPIFSVDTEYRYTAFNPSHAAAMKALYGADIETGKCLLDFQSLKDRATAKDNLDRALRGERLTAESFSGHDLRTRRYFELSHYPIRNPDETVAGVAVYARDTTERNQAEESLKKTNAMLAQTQEITQVGGWEYEVASGRITWTDEVYRIHGVGRDYDPSDVPRAIDFYAPESRPVLEAAFRRAVEQGQPYDLELGFIGADGRPLRVRTVGRPVVENGKTVRVFGNIMDITERKRLEEQLRLRLIELARAQRLSTAGELASNLAHELNQPLTAILSQAERCQVVLGDNPTGSDTLSDKLNRIVQQAQRAAKIIATMRHFIRRDPERTEPIDLNASIREVLELMEIERRRFQIRVDLDLDPTMPLVSGVAIQIQQVLVNVLQNAFEAMQDVHAEKRTVTVATRVESEWAKLTIRDRGKGIRPDQKDQLFDPFYTTKADGLGLGLPLCRSILERHGGSIQVNQNTDCGVTVQIVLPLGLPISGGGGGVGIAGE